MVIKKKRRGGRVPGTWQLLTREDLIKFRAKHKISRSTLARAIGVSATSVQNWETNPETPPVLKSQQRLLELLKRPELLQNMPRNNGGSFVEQPAGPNGRSHAIAATGQIIAAYLTRATVPPGELGELTRSIRAALEQH